MPPAWVLIRKSNPKIKSKIHSSRLRPDPAHRGGPLPLCGGYFKAEVVSRLRSRPRKTGRSSLVQQESARNALYLFAGYSVSAGATQTQARGSRFRYMESPPQARARSRCRGRPHTSGPATAVRTCGLKQGRPRKQGPSTAVRTCRLKHAKAEACGVLAASTKCGAQSLPVTSPRNVKTVASSQPIIAP